MASSKEIKKKIHRNKSTPKISYIGSIPLRQKETKHIETTSYIRLVSITLLATNRIHSSKRVASRLVNAVYETDKKKKNNLLKYCQKYAKYSTF